MGLSRYSPPVGCVVLHLPEECSHRVDLRTA